ncbi:MAG TPA: hypothetical protein VHB97_09095 [Polyangia bacterium]|jgi:hypothetical protein|nr:hypothetical protein [Polyangia bacterium]
MVILRWLSVVASAALLLGVIITIIRSARTVDPIVLRRASRRLGWFVVASFAFSFAIFAASVVRSFSIMAAAAPEQRAAVLAIAIAKAAVYLRWSIGFLVMALVGLAVLRGRAGYHTPQSKS